jgi:hypothetical protein
LSRSAAARLSAVEVVAAEVVAAEVVDAEVVDAEEELAEAREAGGTEELEGGLGVAGITAIRREGTGRKDENQDGERAANRHAP